MKKGILLFTAFSIIMLASCDYRTCPTYTKKPANFEKLENQQNQESPKANAEKV